MAEIEIVFADDGTPFVVVDGIKVAKRGAAGSAQARQWISLEPGWRVSGTARLSISYEAPERQ